MQSFIRILVLVPGATQDASKDINLGLAKPGLLLPQQPCGKRESKEEKKKYQAQDQTQRQML
jgi:hypothetical protein